MNIAHLIWSLKVGGAELMLADIVNQQAKSDQMFIFVVNDDVENHVVSEIDRGVKLILISRPKSSYNPWYWIKLLLLLKYHRIDIIHCHQQSLIKIVRFMSIPKVLTVHDTNITLSNSVNNYNAIFCISESVKNDLLSRYPNVSTQIIYNGIDFRNKKKKVTFGNSPFRIVQVSRLDHAKKGQDILINGVSLLVKDTNEEIILDFIGCGESLDHLNKMVSDFGMQNKCRFLGKKSRKYIYNHLPDYDLLVQPSNNEGFGLTVVEAMSSQVPVLVSNIEGPMEIIKGGTYGFYFNEGDARDCANKIMEIIKESRRAGFYSKQIEIFKYSKLNFDIKKTAIEYSKNYYSLVNIMASNS